jgi:ribosomal protein S27AE
MTQPDETSDPTAVRRLDGNAAAGALAELFSVDVTTASSRCASCGGTSMLGAHHLYADAPALVLRCPTCGEVVLRFASQDGRMLLDITGARLLTFTTAGTAAQAPE